jgi:hypothetical protein
MNTKNDSFEIAILVYISSIVVHYAFLVRIRKIAKSCYYLRHVCLSVHPSVRMEQLDSYRAECYEVWYVFSENIPSVFGFHWNLTRTTCTSREDLSTVIPRLTSDPANEIFGKRIWIRLTNVLVDACANIKQQTWTVGPFQERSSVTFGQIFYLLTEASYWTRGDLPWINFENLKEEE